MLLLLQLLVQQATLTRPFSISLVIMTITTDSCSHTIRQKSPNVDGNGP